MLKDVSIRSNVGVHGCAWSKSVNASLHLLPRGGRKHVMQCGFQNKNPNVTALKQQGLLPSIGFQTYDLKINALID